MTANLFIFNKTCRKIHKILSFGHKPAPGLFAIRPVAMLCGIQMQMILMIAI